MCEFEETGVLIRANLRHAGASLRHAAACRCNNLHLHEGRKITINILSINSLCCSISEVQWSEVFLMIANKLQAHQKETRNFKN